MKLSKIVEQEVTNFKKINEKHEAAQFQLHEVFDKMAGLMSAYNIDIQSSQSGFTLTDGHGKPMPYDLVEASLSDSLERCMSELESE